MPKASGQDHQKQSQLKRFKDTARKLGCGGDESAFENKLQWIAKAKPKIETETEDDEAPE